MQLSLARTPALAVPWAGLKTYFPMPDADEYVQKHGLGSYGLYRGTRGSNPAISYEDYMDAVDRYRKNDAEELNPAYRVLVPLVVPGERSASALQRAQRSAQMALIVLPGLDILTYALTGNSIGTHLSNLFHQIGNYLGPSNVSAHGVVALQAGGTANPTTSYRSGTLLIETTNLPKGGHEVTAGCDWNGNNRLDGTLFQGDEVKFDAQFNRAYGTFTLPDFLDGLLNRIEKFTDGSFSVFHNRHGFENDVVAGNFGSKLEYAGAEINCSCGGPLPTSVPGEGPVKTVVPPAHDQYVPP